MNIDPYSIACIYVFTMYSSCTMHAVSLAWPPLCIKRLFRRVIVLSTIIVTSLFNYTSLLIMLVMRPSIFMQKGGCARLACSYGQHVLSKPLHLATITYHIIWTWLRCHGPLHPCGFYLLVFMAPDQALSILHFQSLLISYLLSPGCPQYPPSSVPSLLCSILCSVGICFIVSVGVGYRQTFLIKYLSIELQCSWMGMPLGLVLLVFKKII